MLKLVVFRLVLVYESYCEFDRETKKKLDFLQACCNSRVSVSVKQVHGQVKQEGTLRQDVSFY